MRITFDNQIFDISDNLLKLSISLKWIADGRETENEPIPLQFPSNLINNHNKIFEIFMLWFEQLNQKGIVEIPDDLLKDDKFCFNDGFFEKYDITLLSDLLNFSFANQIMLMFNTILIFIYLNFKIKNNMILYDEHVYIENNERIKKAKIIPFPQIYTDINNNIVRGLKYDPQKIKMCLDYDLRNIKNFEEEKETKNFKIIGNSLVFSKNKTVKLYKLLNKDAKQKINQIIIQPPTEEIENLAFKDCVHLERVVLPNTIKRIKSSAFAGCLDLKEINIPKSVELIESYAFNTCKNLINVDIPTCITEIGRETFAKCFNLSKIVIPNNVKVIGPDAFMLCEKLQELIIPDSVVEIKSRAFCNCSGLTKIRLPKHVKLSSFAFEYCKNLKEIELPEVVKINNGLLYGCRSLTSLKIPSTVKEIGSAAFKCCRSLKNVEIPDSVTKIEPYAFSECCNVEKIILPYSLLNKDKIKGIFTREILDLIAIDYDIDISDFLDDKEYDYITNPWD